MSAPKEPEITVVVFTEQEPLFELGNPYMTRGANEVLQGLNIEPALLLTRHVLGDWGDMPKSDKTQNNRAVKKGEGRIFSAYTLQESPKITVWVITECDRSCTTILLPEEY
jgi:hypothetical protein